MSPSRIWDWRTAAQSFEDFVAGIVAVLVIKLLEMVNIEKSDADTPPHSGLTRDFLLQILLHITAVVQPGQGVLNGQGCEALPGAGRWSAQERYVSAAATPSSLRGFRG